MKKWTQKLGIDTCLTVSTIIYLTHKTIKIVNSETAVRRLSIYIIYNKDHWHTLSVGRVTPPILSAPRWDYSLLVLGLVIDG